MMLEIKDLNVYYDKKSEASPAVKDFSASVQKSSFCGLIGESGSGKSTVMTSIMGLLPNGAAASGSILYNGEELLGLSEEALRPLRQREIALVPQGAMNSFTPVFTIGRHIEEVLGCHLGIHGAEAAQKCAELLEEVELPKDIARRYPHELSGGQKQRAAIAIALSCAPKLLLADEPTTALDVITQDSVMKLLQRLRAERDVTVLLVTHDMPLAASVCDRLFVMKDGELIESGTPLELINDPKAAHTKALIDSML